MRGATTHFTHAPPEQVSHHRLGPQAGAVVSFAPEKRIAMARVVSEKIWTSEKVRNINPKDWQPEYSWLLPIATADGTFECLPHLVWAQAYAFCRDQRWTDEKVGRLLDELVRVGLLQRATDESGKVWGRWVGSEKFLPSPERCKTNRYKTGRGDLFSDGAATAQRPESDGAAQAQRPLGVGVGSGVGFGSGLGEGVGSGSPKASGNEQPNSNPNIKSVGEARRPSTPTPTPTPAATPKPTATPKREVLSPDEYRRAKDAPALQQAVAELAEELAARPSSHSPEQQARYAELNKRANEIREQGGHCSCGCKLKNFSCAYAKAVGGLEAQ